MLEIKHYFSLYGGSSGDFGIFSSSVETYSCREQFHEEYHKGCTFVSKCHPRIVRAVERKLKLPERKRAIFAKTDKTDWNHIIPNWWEDDTQRFSLFTILLRAGRKYYSLADALKRDKYLQQTKGAVKAFLAGKTNYLEDDYNDYGNEYGWRDRHKGADECVNFRLIEEDKTL